MGTYFETKEIGKEHRNLEHGYQKMNTKRVLKHKNLGQLGNM